MSYQQDEKCGISFAAAYWLRNEGIDFSQHSLGDPAAQIAHRRIRSHHMIHKWEALGLAVPEAMRAGADRLRPVVNGYGVATVPMILGCEGVFAEGHDPYARPLDLDDDAVLALTPPEDFRDNPVMRDLEEQAAWLCANYGTARIEINMQSVPNIAFKLRGEQLMYDFFENPQIAHALLRYLQQTWVNLRSYISARNQEYGSPDRPDQLVTLDNCTVALISPEIYRDFFLPYDRMTAAHYASRFGVHHCGGNMHLFAEDYARLGAGVWFDIGYGSAVAECMRQLQQSEKAPCWSVRYGPAMLRNGDPHEIRREKEMLKGLGANSVACVGVDPDTPEENLLAFLVA